MWPDVPSRTENLSVLAIAAIIWFGADSQIKNNSEWKNNEFLRKQKYILFNLTH